MPATRRTRASCCCRRSSFPTASRCSKTSRRSRCSRCCPSRLARWTSSSSSAWLRCSSGSKKNARNALARYHAHRACCADRTARTYLRSRSVPSYGSAMRDARACTEHLAGADDRAIVLFDQTAQPARIETEGAGAVDDRDRRRVLVRAAAELGYRDHEIHDSALEESRLINHRRDAVRQRPALDRAVVYRAALGIARCIDLGGVRQRAALRDYRPSERAQR